MPTLDKTEEAPVDATHLRVMVAWTGQAIVEVEREDGETDEQTLARVEATDSHYEYVTDSVIARMETCSIEWRLPESWEVER